jgi:hypothetical protein
VSALEVIQALTDAGVPAISPSAKAAKRDAAVPVGTMYSFKGLEFRCVALVGIHDGALPFPVALTPVEVAGVPRMGALWSTFGFDVWPIGSKAVYPAVIGWAGVVVRSLRKFPDGGGVKRKIGAAPLVWTGVAFGLLIAPVSHAMTAITFHDSPAGIRSALESLAEDFVALAVVAGVAGAVYCLKRRKG